MAWRRASKEKKMDREKEREREKKGANDIYREIKKSSVGATRSTLNLRFFASRIKYAVLEEILQLPRGQVRGFIH